MHAQFTAPAAQKEVTRRLEFWVLIVQDVIAQPAAGPRRWPLVVLGGRDTAGVEDRSRHRRQL